jgi:thiosulfate reductase/polysulfide reductase chain A
MMLGKRLGLSDYFQYENEEDYIKQELAPLGFNINELRQKGFLIANANLEEERPPVFNTPSGKIEIYSETLEKAGFPGWPTWIEPPYPKTGEFYLLTGKVGQHTQMAILITGSPQV